MSGHSKWATIKRKKAATDAKRGRMFTRALKEIQVAARMGGGNPDGNPRLKAAIQSAKSVSVPADNIERAIKRGTGDLEGVTYEEILYEGYGPGGVAVMVKTLTDNKNRTASDLRSMFTRGGGNLAGSNAVAYLFSEKGVVTISKKDVKEDALFEAALEAGAEDVKDDGDDWQVISSVQDFPAVRQAVEKLCPRFEAATQFIPSTSVRVAGKEAESLMRLLGGLDEHDDVQDVVANFEMDDKEMEAFSKE